MKRRKLTISYCKSNLKVSLVLCIKRGESEREIENKKRKAKKDKEEERGKKRQKLLQRLAQSRNLNEIFLFLLQNPCQLLMFKQF